MDNDDFSEFCSRVGTDVPLYRECPNCGDLVIVNPETYDKPKQECDPDDVEGCSYWLPCCPCNKKRPIYTWEALEECNYPDCCDDSRTDE